MNIKENNLPCIDIEIKEPIFIIEGKINVFLCEDTNKEGFIAMISEQYYTDIPVIYVDKYFMELPEDCKELVLYHEIGHYVNGDLEDKNISFTEKIKDFYYTIKYSMPICEQLADLYAYNKIENKEKIELYFENLKQVSIHNEIDRESDIKKQLKAIKKCEKYFNKRIKLLYKNIKNFYDPKN